MYVERVKFINKISNDMKIDPYMTLRICNVKSDVGYKKVS